MDEKKANYLIESVFTYDCVGESMAALRRDLKSEDLQQQLIKELIEHASSEGKDSSPEGLEALEAAAKKSVANFIDGSKASQSTGCGS